jgi:uncharacterized protein (DUF983 family)
MPADRPAPVSPLRAGLACRCPRCGRGKLFSGFLTVAGCCPVCGLDFNEIDSGDGPAVFVVFVVGIVVVAGALWVEVKYQPPYWVHAALWLPAIMIGTLGLLRPFKAALFALQYKHRAREGRRDEF